MTMDWVSLARQAAKFNTVEQLIMFATTMGPALPPMKLNITNVKLNTDRVDEIAWGQIPADTIVRNPVALSALGDGACFTYSMVRLLWGSAAHSRGDLQHAAELKVSETCYI